MSFFSNAVSTVKDGFINKYNLMTGAVHPRYPGGIKEWDKAIYRYAYKDSDSPNLLITDYIQDASGNMIAPGYYELILSDDKKFLLLCQSNTVIATIPVFKLQVEEQAQVEHGIEYDKYRKKVEKKRAKENKKLIHLDTQQINQPANEYMQATIEYIRDGRYYLVMYEKGTIRAWGAIK
ncbi:hypothetical protein KBA27_01955 [bacterium]|nr:hypothetical protein [bacterium]